MTVDIVKYEKDMDYESIAMDLGLSQTYVEKYFQNYQITCVMPIRSLDYQETMFVKAIKYVKSLTIEDFKAHLTAYDLTDIDLDRDPLILERTLSSFTDEYHYNTVKKYSLFILEPALLYNNLLSPLLDRLTLEQEIILLTNIASGRGYNGVQVNPKDRMQALEILKEKPIITMGYTDTAKELSLDDIKKVLSFTKDGILKDDEKAFAEEMLRLKEKRDSGTPDPALISEKERKRIERLAHLAVPEKK